jgi:hypothetical protein
MGSSSLVYWGLFTPCKSSLPSPRAHEDLEGTFAHEFLDFYLQLFSVLKGINETSAFYSVSPNAGDNHRINIEATSSRC